MPIDSHLHGQKDEIYWLEETLSQLVFWVDLPSASYS